MNTKKNKLSIGEILFNMCNLALIIGGLVIYFQTDNPLPYGNQSRIRALSGLSFLLAAGFGLGVILSFGKLWRAMLPISVPSLITCICFTTLGFGFSKVEIYYPQAPKTEEISYKYTPPQKTIQSLEECYKVDTLNKIVYINPNCISKYTMPYIEEFQLKKEIVESQKDHYTEEIMNKFPGYEKKINYKLK